MLILKKLICFLILFSLFIPFSQAQYNKSSYPYNFSTFFPQDNGVISIAGTNKDIIPIDS
jgi:hypothetical protein